jgi:hypothetical protein
MSGALVHHARHIRVDIRSPHPRDVCASSIHPARIDAAYMSVEIAALPTSAQHIASCRPYVSDIGTSQDRLFAAPRVELRDSPDLHAVDLRIQSDIPVSNIRLRVEHIAHASERRLCPPHLHARDPLLGDPLPTRDLTLKLSTLCGRPRPLEPRLQAVIFRPLCIEPPSLRLLSRGQRTARFDRRVLCNLRVQGPHAARLTRHAPHVRPFERHFGPAALALSVVVDPERARTGMLDPGISRPTALPERQAVDTQPRPRGPCAKTPSAISQIR